MNTLRRTLHTETRVIDAKAGLVEYVASDESIDSYREVIRAAGWRFNRFAKNAPFVDSHDYSTIDKLLGQVVDFQVAGGKLIETVKWAKDVPENLLAQKGWAMTEAGYLKAVSVGFIPMREVSRFSGDRNLFNAQVDELGLKGKPEEELPRTIFIEQEQIELSAVVIGANPNAIARSYKAGILSDADLETFSSEYVRRYSPAAVEDALAAEHRARERQRFLENLQTIIQSS